MTQGPGVCHTQGHLGPQVEGDFPWTLVQSTLPAVCMHSPFWDILATWANCRLSLFMCLGLWSQQTVSLASQTRLSRLFLVALLLRSPPSRVPSGSGG